LSGPEQETLLGTSLSRRFTMLPLWLSHPANIGAFYGLLISFALILPYRFAGEDNSSWLPNWVFHASLLMVADSLVQALSSCASTGRSLSNAIRGVGPFDAHSH
jgi:hypothetical protein